MSANITKQSMDRIGKCIGSIIKAMDRFDGESEVKPVTGTHSKAKITKDINTIVKQLVEAKVFKPNCTFYMQVTRNIVPSPSVGINESGPCQLFGQTWRQKIIILH